MLRFSPPCGLFCDAASGLQNPDVQNTSGPIRIGTVGRREAIAAHLTCSGEKSVSNRWTGKSNHLWAFFGLLAQMDVRNPSHGFVEPSSVSRLGGKTGNFQRWPHDLPEISQNLAGGKKDTLWFGTSSSDRRIICRRR